MRAIVEKAIPNAQVALVFSNNPNAPGLKWASERGLRVACIPSKGRMDRAAYDQEVAAAIDAVEPDLLALAGYMRILSPEFCERYAGRMLNIHPALLPAFKGTDTHERAIAAGCRLHGCTVHFVTPDLDAGPIVAQAAVPVLSTDTPDSLADRVLAQEHRIYPQACADVLSGAVRLENGKAVRSRPVSDPLAFLIGLG